MTGTLRSGTKLLSTLISRSSTCLGFASPATSDVATDEPGWVTWKSIPSTSWTVPQQSTFRVPWLLQPLVKNLILILAYQSPFSRSLPKMLSKSTCGSIKHSCSWPQITKSKNRAKKCSLMAFLGFVFTLPWQEVQQSNNVNLDSRYAARVENNPKPSICQAHSWEQNQVCKQHQCTNFTIPWQSPAHQIQQIQITAFL